MDIDSFGLKLIEVLSPALLAALTWAAARLAQLIRAKVQNEYLQGLLIRLDDAVLTVVKDLQQSMVQQIKCASADGKLSESEKQQLKATAMSTVKSHLGDKGRAEAARILGLQDGGLEALLSSKIEAAVHDLHHPTTPPGGATSAAVVVASAPAAA